MLQHHFERSESHNADRNMQGSMWSEGLIPILGSRLLVFVTFDYDPSMRSLCVTLISLIRKITNYQEVVFTTFSLKIKFFFFFFSLLVLLVLYRQVQLIYFIHRDPRLEKKTGVDE